MASSSTRVAWAGCSLLLTAMLVTAAVLAATTSCGAGEEVIKVASCPDLSGPGSEVGKPMAMGMRHYFEYVNGKGGVNGRKIDYLETDGNYNIATEVAAFNRFAMEGIPAFITFSGGGMLQIRRLGAKKKIVVISASPQEVYVEGPDGAYAFIPASSYDLGWAGALKYMKDKNPGKKLRVAIVQPDNPFGQQNAEVIRRLAKKQGVEVVGSEVVQFKDFDATPAMLKIKAVNPDVVLMPQVEPSVAVIMRDARKVGIDTKKMQFISTQNGMGPYVLKLGGKDVEDLLAMGLASLWTDDHLPGIKAMRDAPSAPKEDYGVWYVYGWNIGAVLCEGMRRVGDKAVTGENLKAALESIKDWDNGGVTAPISFSPTNHIGACGVKVYRPNLQKGHFEAVSDWICVRQ